MEIDFEQYGKDSHYKEFENMKSARDHQKILLAPVFETYEEVITLINLRILYCQARKV